MNILKFFFAFVLLTSIGCSESEQMNKPGYFTLSRVESQSGGRKTRQQLSPDIEFDLGSLKASREFSFLLGNGDTTTITDIELSTNHPAFEVSPAKISNLSGSGSSSSNIIPIVSVGILHGIMLNGVGYADILEMGEHSATLTISGKTIIDGSTIEVQSDFKFTISAKVMDVTLLSNNEEIDYSNFIGQWSGNEFESGLPAIPGYDFNPANIKIKNTGNVPVSIVFSQLASDPEGTITMALDPNQTKNIELPQPTQNNFYFALLAIDGNGTITNRSRVKQGDDGKGYLILQHDF